MKRLFRVLWQWKDLFLLRLGSVVHTVLTHLETKNSCAPGVCGLQHFTLHTQVHLGSLVSLHPITFSSESPHGCVLSPLLFSLLSKTSRLMYCDVCGWHSCAQTHQQWVWLQTEGGTSVQKSFLCQRKENQGDGPTHSPCTSEEQWWKWCPASGPWEWTWSRNTSCLVKKAHWDLYVLSQLRPAGPGSSVLNYRRQVLQHRCVALM